MIIVAVIRARGKPHGYLAKSLKKARKKARKHLAKKRVTQVHICISAFSAKSEDDLIKLGM